MKRLPASAMFYAVTLALVIGGVMGALVLMVHLRNERTGRWLQLERARSNVRSAAHWALVQQPLDAIPTETVLFPDGGDTISMQRVSFGVLDLVHTSAKVQGRIITEQGLAGGAMPQDRVLELDGSAGPLHLAGEARITGNVRVPGGDVRRGFIEGRPFTGSVVVDGQVERQQGELQVVPKATRERVVQWCTENPGYPLVPYAPLGVEEDPVEVTALQGLPVIEFVGPKVWGGARVQGPVLIRCTDTLTLMADLDLHWCIVQAPFIIIRAGFKGDIQCFATRGITLGNGCMLKFPSLLAVERDVHHDAGAFIHIASDALVQGGVVALDEGLRGRSGALVRIDAGAQVDGEVLVEGAIQHQGTIRGLLRAKELHLRTAASIYRGYILDGRIMPWVEGGGWTLGLMGDPALRRMIDRS